MLIHENWKLRAARRRRAPVKKSSNGCIECKRRKVKCDETLPHCRQCTKRNVPCPGKPIARGLRWSTKHEVLQRKDAVGNRQMEKPRPTSRPSSELSPLSPAFETSSCSDHCGESDQSDETIAQVDPDQHDLVRSIPSDDDDLREDLNPIPPVSNVAGIAIPRDPFFLELEDFMLRFESPAVPIPHLEDSIEAEYADTVKDSNAFAVDDEFPSTCLPSMIQSFESGGDTISNLDCALETAHSCLGLTRQIVDLPSSLIVSYFSFICPIFSFDSQKNPFRYYVERKWQSSALLFNVMISMTAAKLTYTQPSMSIIGLEYQSKALQILQHSFDGTKPTPPEIMFGIMMLGLSSSWHNGSDQGISHLRAAQNVIRSGQLGTLDADIDPSFFVKTLTYWEMVVSPINDDVLPLETIQDLSNLDADFFDRNPSSTTIRPHTLLGVTIAPQKLFARSSQCIRKLRAIQRQSSVTWTSVEESSRLIKTAKSLEEEIWKQQLPKLQTIEHAEDDKTPAFHYILLAEAYLYVSLYQIYYIFPDILEDRRSSMQHIAAEGSVKSTWTSIKSESWSMFQDKPSRSRILRYFGNGVVTRMEQIDLNSSTACVHKLPLLASASSLTIDVDEMTAQEQEQTLQRRKFILDRLRYLETLALQISFVQISVKEIFRILERGKEAFWIDVLQNLQLEVVLG